MRGTGVICSCRGDFHAYNHKLVVSQYRVSQHASWPTYTMYMGSMAHIYMISDVLLTEYTRPLKPYTRVMSRQSKLTSSTHARETFKIVHARKKQ